MKALNLVERVIALENVELLRGLTPDQLSQIAYIASQIHVAPGKVLLETDKPLHAMYVLLDGSVELSRNGEVLDTARQNDVLGSWALFDDTPPPLTARAAEDTVLLEIRRDDFFDLLADNVEIASTLLSTLVKRFRALLEAPGAP
jgi:CRP-like cAMP-binding protein